MTQENKDALYREEYFNYCNENEIKVLAVEHLRFYLAGRRKGQELIDSHEAQMEGLESERCKLHGEVESLKKEIDTLERINFAWGKYKTESDLENQKLREYD